MMESESWFTVALRRTWIPFTAVFLSFAIGGAIAQSIAPKAHSIGDLLRLITQ